MSAPITTRCCGSAPPCSRRRPVRGTAVTGAVSDTLDVWDGHLAAHGAQLIAARVELVNAALSGGGEGVPTAGARVSSGVDPLPQQVEQIDGQNETVEFFEAALLDALGPPARRRNRARRLSGRTTPRRSRAAARRPGRERLCEPRRIVVDGVGAAAGGLRVAALRRRRPGAVARRRVRRVGHRAAHGRWPGWRPRPSRFW